MRIERVVVDTNVLISAALSSTAPPARLVRHVLAQGTLMFCEATFAELHSRLWRPKFDRYLSLEDRKLLLHDFSAAGIWVDVPASMGGRAFSRDPDDDKFVHLALAGQASLVVSGDRDLLDLEAIEGIPIRTPAQACTALGI